MLRAQLENIPYEKTVREKILTFLKEDVQAKGLKGGAIARFSILSSGYLKDEPLITQASSEELRDYLVKAIKSASPFEKFPERLKKSEESFHLEVLYE